MIKYYLLLAGRNLLKRKATALVMLTGLTIGLVCLALVGLYVKHESTYDTSFTDHNTIYRLTFRNGEGEHMAGSPSALAPFLEEFAPVTTVCRTFYPYLRSGTSGLIEANGKKVYEREVIYADSTFFRLFDAPFREGKPSEALNALDKMVLSEQAARRYFGDQSALGQMITLDNEHIFRVSGVVDFPTHSHLVFDFLIPAEFQPSLLNEWTRWPCWTYLRVEQDQQVTFVEEQVGNVLIDHASPYDPLWSSYRFDLQPIHQIHTSNDMHWDVVPKVAPTQLRMLLGIALSVLLLGSINFVNLATAKADERAKESGVKKLLGANRLSLIAQFMVEALFLSTVGGLLALLFLPILLPFFNELADARLSANFIDSSVILAILGGSMLTGILAGLYPAWVLSMASPGLILKSQSAARTSRPWLRKSLVIFQLAISIGLIIATIIVQDQLRYMQQLDLGYSQQGVLSVRLQEPNQDTFQRLSNELLSHASINQVAAASHTVGAGSGTWSFYPPGMALEDQQSLADYMRVDYQFFDLLNIQFMTGRPFSPDRPSDRRDAVIINEAAVQQWGLTDPLNIPLRTDIDQGVMREKQIVGVVENFNYKSPEYEVTPLVLAIDSTTTYRNVYVKATDLSEAVAHVESLWTSYFPDFPVEYQFQDAIFAQTFRQHQTFREVLSVFSFIAIIVSCLGMLGLISYVLIRRRKEMSVRKVLGSSAAQLFILITQEFLLLVGLANLVIWPIIYWLMQQWLTGFAARTEINAWLFLASLVTSLLFVLLIISWQTLRAATVNPATILRSE